jgi:hypothetical protein
VLAHGTPGSAGAAVRRVTSRCPLALLPLLCAPGQLVLLPGCDPAVERQSDLVSGALCPPASPLTYDSFGRQFFTDYCLRCHASQNVGEARNGAPASINFDDLELVRMHRRRIDQVAGSGPLGTATFMPWNEPVPSTEVRTQLSQWLACGAP